VKVIDYAKMKHSIKKERMQLTNRQITMTNRMHATKFFLNALKERSSIKIGVWCILY